jgi:UDP-N-acetylmuramoyl-tripeptide--D-alanyl-D-alanine ligase
LNIDVLVIDEIPSDMFLERVSTDTREEVFGGLFVALNGNNFNGHDFVNEAIGKGAKAVLVSEDVLVEEHAIILKTTNMVKTLMQIAAYYRNLLDVFVVAITGSVGKTSTKELLATVLEQKYRVTKTKDNLNNEIGVFKSVLSLTKKDEVAVLELGMCARGEIAQLSLGVCPNIAVITKIGVTHLSFLGTRENIFKEKMEITAGLKTGGLLILNGDDEYLCNVKPTENFKLLFCGLKNQNAAFIAKNIQVDINGTNFEIVTSSESLEVYIPAAGNHQVLNALLVYAVAKNLQLTNSQIRQGFCNYVPNGARQKVIEKCGVTYVLDYYNANPDSVEAAITVLAKLENKLKIFVFGDMGELGQLEMQEHKRVGALISVREIWLFCVGDAAKFTAEEAKRCGCKKVWWFAEKQMLAEALMAKIEKGAIVWVKGSRFMQMEDIELF